MCHRPTKEETTRSDALRAAAGPSRRADNEHADELGRDPSSYPEPRGNGEMDRGETDRSAEKLATVLGR